LNGCVQSQSALRKQRRKRRSLRFQSARAYHLKSPSNFLPVISYLCFGFSLRNCAPRFGSDALTVLSKEDANTFDKVIATNLRGIFLVFGQAAMLPKAKQKNFNVNILKSAQTN
jgi:hypothetical protein